MLTCMASFLDWHVEFRGSDDICYSTRGGLPQQQLTIRVEHIRSVHEGSITKDRPTRHGAGSDQVGVHDFQRASVAGSGRESLTMVNNPVHVADTIAKLYALCAQ